MKTKTDNETDGGRAAAEARASSFAYIRLRETRERPARPPTATESPDGSIVHVLLQWKTFTFETRRGASGAAFRGKGGTKRRARVRKLLRFYSYQHPTR